MAGVGQEYIIFLKNNRGGYYFCVNIILGEEMAGQLPPQISASYMAMDSNQSCRMQSTHIQA